VVMQDLAIVPLAAPGMCPSAFWAYLCQFEKVTDGTRTRALYFGDLSVLRFRGCHQITSKLAIIIMSSCSKLWQWKT
jgi:hypothetical protein